MQLVTADLIQEWLVIDSALDFQSVDLLIESGIDIVEHETGLILRPYVDPLTYLTITPNVPASLNHAIAVFVAANFNDREGDAVDGAMVTVRRLCAPFRMARL